jgi:hypothetical protein
MPAHRLGHRGLVQMRVHAVGREHEDVTSLQRQRVVVDVQPRIEADCAAEVALPLRHLHAVVGGELLHRTALQPVDPRIADVEDVRRMCLEHQRAQRAHVASVHVLAIRALLRARVQP